MASASGLDEQSLSVSIRTLPYCPQTAVFVDDFNDAELVLSASDPMMQSSRPGEEQCSEKSDADLLATFRDLLLLTDNFNHVSADLFQRHDDLFSSVWSRLCSRDANLSLAGLFKHIARLDSANLSRVTGFVQSLDAYSTERLDEADFDKRLNVFDEVTGREVTLTSRE